MVVTHLFVRLSDLVLYTQAMDEIRHENEADGKGYDIVDSEGDDTGDDEEDDIGDNERELSAEKK